MLSARQLPVTQWESQLETARQSARLAGQAVRPQFGIRLVSAYKGQHDVQLRADIIAQESILLSLTNAFPTYGIIAEEGDERPWSDTGLTWAVDPLDGTNNFGYGIAHCAIAITLFKDDAVVVAVVYDPLLEREYFATEDKRLPAAPPVDVPMRRATVSLVTGYTNEGRIWGARVNESLSFSCKRLVSMWAPALDLALVATGAMDAMVCYMADFLDVCGGMFLLASAGGCILDFAGRPTSANRSMARQPVSFVAARTPALAQELLLELQQH